MIAAEAADGQRLRDRAAAWLEPLTLRVADERARQLSDAARARMTPWVLAARSRVSIARELGELEAQIVALSLLREAALLTLRALEHAAPSPALSESDSNELWERFGAELTPHAPEQFERVRRAFGSPDPLAIDRLSETERRELRAPAEAGVAWLLSLAEIRSLPELGRARVVRSLLAALTSLAGLALLIAYWLSLSALSEH